VGDLLQDPIRGAKWVPKPYTKASIEVDGSIKEINSTFRHVACHRISRTGYPFKFLTYVHCSRIPQEGDFRMGDLREDKLIEKRGSQGTGDDKLLRKLLKYTAVAECVTYSV
jgi:hypothetical protein